MTHIIVPRISPVKSFGTKIFVLILLSALLIGAFALGRSSLLDKYFPQQVEKIVVIEQEIPQQSSDNNIFLLEKKYKVELEACNIIKETLETDKQKIMELEKDLAFYKAIVTPAKDKGSVYLQSLEIVPVVDKESDNSKKLYKYKFIVAQKVKKRSQTKGTISFKLKGKQAGKDLNFSLSSRLEKNTKQQKSFPFSFKYFLEVEDIINLPEGFEIQGIDVNIKTTKKKSSIILSDLKWDEKKGLKYVGQ